MKRKYTAADFSAEEKIRLLAGKDSWHTEDFGGRLYEVTVSDGPLGLRTPVRNEKGEWTDKPAVAYPSTQILSQTWRTEYAYETGKMLADDCMENGVDVLLAPGVNIKRNPLCGRNFEYVSEDPYLAGVFGREYIRGLQDKHVGATLKHFCCNNLEFSRFWLSSEVDERPLREIYLRPFEISCEAKPWAVMCSYNLVNGVRMSEHKKLYTLLRGEFGFDGMIMSDWGAVKDHAASVKAGLDLEMPYSETGYQTLKAAYEAGEVTDEELDVCAQRVLDFISRCEEESKKRKITSTREERLDAAQKVAEEGIVLLKNEGALPLKDGSRVSLTGDPVAQYLAGGGSSRVQLKETPPSLAECLKAVMPAGEFSYKGVWDNEGQFYQAINNAYGKDAAIVCVGTEDGEGWDRSQMRLPAVQEEWILETAKQNANTIVIVFAGAPVDMSLWIDEVAAVVWAGYPGERGGRALANILTGKVNPSGRLTESFPFSQEDCPVVGGYRDAMKTLYSEGLLVGYRWYDAEREKENYGQTLFPFGYGLSYSKFEYSALAIEKAGEGVEVSFDIANVSQRAGAETAQINVREVHSKVFRPFKELKGFEKIYLEAGEKKRLRITLDKNAFAFYSSALDKWTVNRGVFEIFVAANAEDIRLKGSVEIE